MTEYVRDYPRPPRVEPVDKRVRVVFGGTTIADTTRAQRVLETFGAPVYYVPAADVRMDLLTETDHRSVCEWKGVASYYSIGPAERVGWAYHDPKPGYDAIKGHVAFYCRPMDACYVGDEQAQPQPGGFYGGWITAGVVGPFKGEPGTEGW
ncbi:MAG TPA: DUF427 domain-containing protein [Candidatus Limnocylindria bacterium]|nr:DUF427 domain-containing protein [Candidatus Limnocylindria bacterium]